MRRAVHSTHYTHARRRPDTRHGAGGTGLSFISRETETPQRLVTMPADPDRIAAIYMDGDH